MKENEREEKSLAPDEDAAARQKRRQQEDRSRFFQLLAGGYLVYLAWQLISGAIGDKDWQTTKLVGVIAGIVFAAECRQRPCRPYPSYPRKDRV